MALPFWISGFGILAATIGFWTVSTKDDASQTDLLHALHRGVYTASVLVIVFAIACVEILFDGSVMIEPEEDAGRLVFTSSNAAKMLRSARGFDNYNFRDYTLRYVRDDFRAHRGADAAAAAELYAKGLEQHDQLKRLATVSTLYPEEAHAME